jgi:c-di-GMP-binding flagellar brake protein YcgR
MNAEDQSPDAPAGLAGDIEDQRRHPRTREYGPQDLMVCFTGDNAEMQTVKTVLWDFSEGGLGMESSVALPSDQEITISGELHSPYYSVAFRSKARVVYCRPITSTIYRVGVSFREVSYRRLTVDKV